MIDLGVRLTLLIGVGLPLPAPLILTEQLDEVEIRQQSESSSTFQLRFNADRAQALAAADYPILASQLLAIGNRVIVVVTIGPIEYVLMDGFITHQELAHSAQMGASTISVSGEDVSVRMGLTTHNQARPELGDLEIVLEILATYAEYGIVPVTFEPRSNIASVQLESTPQQNYTDLAYLKMLARMHGFIFMVRPGLVPGENTAYWGPPPRIGAIQPALTVDMGNATNVESISFSYDGMAPVLYSGFTQDDETDEQAPVLSAFLTRIPLSAMPAVIRQQPFVRQDLYVAPDNDESEAEDDVQSLTDLASDRVVTASGSIDAIRYGGILMTPGIVGVRGAGYSYDGLYYVDSVTHTLSRGKYKQSFALTREGIGSTVPVVMP